MMAERPFKTVRFVAADRSVDDRAYVEPEVSFDAGGAPDVAALARHYLVRVLELETASDMSFDGTAAPAPEVELANVQASKLTATSVVRFTQARAAIPIFGSHMVVELDAAGKLVGVDAELAAVHDVSPVPTLDPSQAAARIAAFVGIAADALELAAPVLHYYHEEHQDEEDSDRWHLVWVFRDVPAAPPELGHGHAGRGHGRSPRTRAPRMHYLVDAHDGAIVLYYSAAPRVAAATPEVPIRCFGVDELGVRHEFYGRAVDGGFSLHDPLRGLQTLDLAGGDISIEPIRLPKAPIRHPKAEFGAEHAAAVAAHVNVARVLDFYRAILLRDSVDDKGMEIVSVVHCISSEDEDPPDWGNAIWWNGRMWYGQMRTPDGKVRSLSGYLDIIAHELTHGLIEHTADLLYKSQSGALNESLCDIFGTIVANWYQVGPDSDTSKWSWQIGPGLGEDGKPVRDLENPARTGDPAHMNNYLRTREDDGGVHTNSNIHNKAAYHLLTATDSKGDKQVTPREAAMLYYMCLMRLPQRATFARTLRGLLDVAKTYFAGDPIVQARKLAAIEKAYAKVGIVLEVED
jgi:bacillolysin